MKQGFFLITLLCLSPAYGQQVSPVAQNLRSGLDPQSDTQHQASTTAANPAGSYLSSRILEYNGAIRILETGLRNNWPLERYLVIFDEIPVLGSANTQPESSRRLVRELLTPLQSPRTIWDERPPTNVEILRVLEELRSQRGLAILALSEIER